MRGRGVRQMLGVVCVLGLVAAACANESSSKSSPSTSGPTATVDQPGVTKTEIRVGGVASISNPLNAPYADIFDGVKAYFAMVNNGGGIYGRKLAVVAERDDQISQNLREVQGLVNEDNVFAAVGMATIFDFSGASELEQKGIPTFGWNINTDWNRSNFFGNLGALCIGCVSVEVPWIAQELGKKTVGVITYGSVDNANKCGEGIKKSLEKYPSAKVGYYSSAHAFGDVDYSVDVQKMKEANVDLITTCMDTNAVLAIQKEVRAQNLDAIQYLPNGYDQEFMKANGAFFENSIVRVPFVPFETTPRPKGLDDYLRWMKKQNKTPNEYTTYGWINGAMLVEGLRAAGPNFTQQKVIDELNQLTNDTAGGMLSGIDWTTQHAENRPLLGCSAYVKVVNGKFVSAFVPKGKVFLCFRRDADLTTKVVYK
ncbi:MAG: ABC transporter substrate-binding protein [Acidimicrobiia bacterium]|nr:ABC transporter substrate-binding protein [Acidimicrobiia bacterium]